MSSTAADAAPETPVAAAPAGRAAKLKAFAKRFERTLMMTAGVIAALGAVAAYDAFTPAPKEITQQDIDSAVLHTLKNQPPAPSKAAVAYDVIRPSIVLVRRLGKEGEPEVKKDKGSEPKALPPAKEKQSARKGPDTKGKEGPSPTDKAPNDKNHGNRGLGTGVVISDEGLVMTCLHVIAGAERVGLVFGDGMETDAEVVSVQPENDLAVLKPKSIPDDLVPATLRSTKGLKVGDEVVAVGFPFGIGPSTTFGVVSGLRREHESQEGQRSLVDLIQFDAAANPGNSGGPLVTTDGDVVGIVTSILNPTDKGFFVGIAFAVPIENAASAAGLSPF